MLTTSHPSADLRVNSAARASALPLERMTVENSCMDTEATPAPPSGVHADAETRLREQIKAYPKWIETGERRAREINAEFKERAVTDFLPPAAPFDRVFDPLQPAPAKAP